MTSSPNTTAHAFPSGNIILDTGDRSASEFTHEYSRSLNAVLMLVFSNAQMELDQQEMLAIRNVMDLALQLQSVREEEGE